MDGSYNSPGARRPSKALRILIGVAVLGLVLYQAWQNGLDHKPVERPADQHVDRQIERPDSSGEVESQSFNRDSERKAERQPQPKFSSLPPIDRTAKFPPKVIPVLAHIEKAGEPLDGYEGGRKFLNLGRDGEEKLPQTDARGKRIDYREWDVNPRVAGKNRGAERLVTGSDGSAYYTADHYRTYTKIH